MKKYYRCFLWILYSRTDVITTRAIIQQIVAASIIFSANSKYLGAPEERPRYLKLRYYVHFILREQTQPIFTTRTCCDVSRGNGEGEKAVANIWSYNFF